MKISELKRREDFEGEFTKAVKRFLLAKQNKVVSIEWGRLKGKEKKWYCFDHFNIIFSSYAKPSVFQTVKDEYGSHPNQLRSFIQSFFVWLFVNTPVRFLVSKCRLLIKPGIINESRISFLGGNNKIRMNDYHSKQSVSIFKSNSRNIYFKNEVLARTTLIYDFIVPLIDIDSMNMWYSEPILQCIPINRMSNQAHRDYLPSFFSKYFAFQSEHKYRTSTHQYIQSVLQLISEAIGTSQISVSSKGDIKGVVECLRLKLATQSREFPDSLELTASHGDFQPSNIVFVESAIKLIDWEYFGQRTVFYDYFTYLLKFRYPEGLSDRLRVFIDNGIQYDPYVSEEVLQLLQDDIVRKFTVYICILEDICVQSLQHLNHHYQGIEPSFLAYLSQLKKFSSGH